MAYLDTVLKRRVENELSERVGTGAAPTALSIAWNSATTVWEDGDKNSPLLRKQVVQIFMDTGMSYHTAEDMARDLIHGQRPMLV